MKGEWRLMQSRPWKIWASLVAGLIFWFTIGLPLWDWIVCPFRLFTGVECPLCGLGHSVESLVRGEWSNSLGFHPFGLVIAGIAVVAVTELVLWTVSRRIYVIRISEKARKRWGAGLGIVLACHWVGQLL